MNDDLADLGMTDMFKIVDSDHPPADAHGIVFHYYGDPTAEVRIKADRPGNDVVRDFMYYNLFQPDKHCMSFPKDRTLGCYFFVMVKYGVKYGVVPPGIRVSVGTQNVPFKYLVALDPNVVV